MQSFDFDVIQRSLPYLFREGMTFTVTLTLMAMTGGIVFGTLLAMMRLSSLRPLSIAAGAYVNLMRSVPLVLVIFWFFFLVPYIGAWAIGAKQTIILFQDTSLVYVISATDFLGAAAKIANRDYRLVEMYTFVAVVYFAVSYGLSTLVRRLQERIAIIK